jgi:hypothetical protein
MLRFKNGNGIWYGHFLEWTISVIVKLYSILVVVMFIAFWAMLAQIRLDSTVPKVSRHWAKSLTIKNMVIIGKVQPKIVGRYNCIDRTSLP